MTSMEPRQYDPDYLKAINNSVSLYDYAKEQLPFEWRGKNYWTNCPSDTHQDDTPSLAINPKLNIFHCFACGAGGGIINWLRFYEKLSFDDAVQKAANLGNVGTEKKRRSKTLMVAKALAPKPSEKFEHQVLNQREYLKYDDELPDEWREEGITDEAMKRYYVRLDKKSNRIVYPVFDASGNFINIKGRTRNKFYHQLKIPKYINYFSVGKLDYFQGWEQALTSAKAKNEIIIFEGIKSCMKAYGWGFDNTVSAECHGINEDQMHLLMRLGCDVVVAFDSDVDPKKIQGIDELNRFLNVFVIDGRNILGEKEAPVDQGRDIWEQLYKERVRF